jgi:hypothetical protein
MTEFTTVQIRSDDGEEWPGRQQLQDLLANGWEIYDKESEHWTYRDSSARPVVHAKLVTYSLKK